MHVWLSPSTIEVLFVRRMRSSHSIRDRGPDDGCSVLSLSLRPSHLLYYREVQLDFTPEMAVFLILFERCHTKYRNIYLKQHIKYFNFQRKIQLDHPVLSFFTVRRPSSNKQRVFPSFKEKRLIEGQGHEVEYKCN